MSYPMVLAVLVIECLRIEATRWNLCYELLGIFE